MLRVLALLAAPVFAPLNPNQPSTPQDLHKVWHVLDEGGEAEQHAHNSGKAFAAEPGGPLIGSIPSG